MATVIHSVDDFAGRRLLAQCREHLAPGGQLIVVANRHLPYGRSLRQDFAAVRRAAQNDKFVIWQAQAVD